MPVRSDILSIQNEMIEWRRYLHAHPETAFQEFGTSAFVIQKLKSFGIEVKTGYARTGVVGTITNGRGPAIALRADMDALSIMEENQFQHRSTHEGTMHACGHDGHTAMLLGAAKILASSRHFEGTIHFIFQPAEENEGGGQVMVDEDLFDEFPVEAVFGMHNWPGMPTGTFGIKSGPIMASFDYFDITVNGKGCHAAMPQLGKDSILIASEIIAALHRISSRRNPVDPAVLSVTKIHGGETWNILPEHVRIGGTVRSFNQLTQDEFEDKIRSTVRGICEAHGVTAGVEYIRKYPPTVNSVTETEIAKRAAEAVMSGSEVLQVEPSMGSEDFAFMLKKTPGAYIWVGNGPAAGGCLLHSPHYDFNDEAMPVGTAYWVELAENYAAHAATVKKSRPA